MKSQAFFSEEKHILFRKEAHSDCFCVLSHSFTYPNLAPPQEKCLIGIIAYEYYVIQEAASLRGAATFENLQASNCVWKSVDFEQKTDQKYISSSFSLAQLVFGIYVH